MADILEYTFSLKELLSSKFQKIGINNDMMLDSFAKLEQQSKKVSDGFKYMGESTSTLQQKVALLQAERDLIPVGNFPAIAKYNSEIKKLNGEIDQLQTADGSKVKTWFNDALGSLPGIASNPITLLGNGIAGAVRKGMEADMQKANILNLLKGDAEKAKALYKNLSDYGIKSPYDKAGLIEAQQEMMKFGVSADDSFGKLKEIGDIARGDSQQMQALSSAFGQASAAGKLNSQGLEQMMNAGFNPLQTISDKTGESMLSLQNRMSKGAISIQEVSQAFTWATSEGGEFYKGAANASETLGGKWSNMMEMIDELALQVYSVIEPLITPLVGMLSSLVGGLITGVGWLIQKFKEGNPYVLIIAGAIGAFTAALILHNTYTAIASTLTNKLTLSVIQSNLAFLANPVTWIIAGVIALIAVIAFLIFKIDGWGEAWKHTVNGAKLLFQIYVESVKLYFSTMVEGILIGINKIKEGWYKFKNAVGIGNQAENSQMLAQINEDTEKRKKAITDGVKKVAELGANAKTEFQAAGGSLKWNNKSISDITGGLKSSLGIGPSVLPGADLDAGTGAVDTKNNAVKTNEAIATGGTKSTTLNISFKNLVEAVHISKAGFAESTKNMEEEVANAMLRVLAMANTTAG